MIIMKNVIDDRKDARATVEQRDTVRKNRDSLIRKAERQRIIRKGIPVIFMFTITAGIYGYSLGRKSGYLDGVHAGYVKGGQELMASWRDHSEQLRLSREANF